MQNEATRGKRAAILVLAVMIAVQAAVFVYFGTQKQGYFVDEIFTYELSNAYYAGLSYSNNALHTRWYDGEFFANLLMPREHRFAYDSVYHNQARDVHPPLYYFIHHTVSSFFPDTFSKWIGIIPNIVYFAATICLLYALGRRVFNSGWLALVPCALYGFSVGAINTVVFIRMYALLTLLCVWTTSLHYGVLTEKTIGFKRYAAIFLCTFLGFMTQYYFLMYAFFLSACTVLYLLVKGRVKQSGLYAGTMALALGGGYLFFPACVHHLQGYRGEGSVSSFLSGPNWSRQGKYLKLLDAELFGGYGRWILLALAAAVLLGVVVGLLRRSRPLAPARLGPSHAYFFFALGLSCALFVFMIAWIAPYTNSRYIYCVFPLIFLLVTRLALFAFSFLMKKRWIPALALVLAFTFFCADGIAKGRIAHLYPEHRVCKEIPAKYDAGAYVIRLGSERNYETTFSLDEFALYDHVLLTDFRTMFSRKFTPAKEMPLGPPGKLVLYLARDIEQEMLLDMFKIRYGFTEVTHLAKREVDHIYLLE